MRLIPAAFALLLLAGPAAAETPASERPADHAGAPVSRDRNFLLDGPPKPADCRDRVEMVREERGLPRLQRENARPGEVEALMFYAVDRQIDGCDVLVMVSDPRDVRPLPPPESAGWQLLPAQ